MNLLEISKFLSLAAGITTIGLLLAIAFFLSEIEGKLGKSATALRRTASISALLWTISTGALIIATLANILGTNLSGALDTNSLRSFISQVTLGKYMFAQLCLALLISLVVARIRGVAGASALLLISLVAIIAPVFESHSASSGSHALAVGSLVVHVVAISLWVGGLVAIAFLNSADRAIALPRFSALALWAAIAVAVSGSANAWARLNFQSAWNSDYASLVVIKILLTALLIFFGYINRIIF
jgi:putative copper resistance protein D